MSFGRFDFADFGELSRKRRKNQQIRVVQTVEPTLSVLTIDETRNYLKIDTMADDDLIADMIMASQRALDNQLGGFNLVEQEWKQIQNGGIERIELLKHPVRGVPTVTVFDSFDSTGRILELNVNYRLVENRLYSADGFFEEGRSGDGYEIIYRTGRYDASTINEVDPALKNAIKRMVGFLYENREEFIVSVNEGNWAVTYDLDKDPVGIKYVVMNYHNGMGII